MKIEVQFAIKPLNKLVKPQGLSAEYDFKKIVKVAKKEFCCNGTVVEHPEYGEVHLHLHLHLCTRTVIRCECISMLHPC